MRLAARVRRGAPRRRGNDAVFAWLQVRHLETFALQLAAGIQYRLVLDLRGNEVLALACIEMRHALDGEVVRLGSAGSPDDFTRIGIDQLGHLATGILDCFFGLPAKHMGTRSRVTEIAFHQQAVAHFLRNARVDRRSRGVIQVNRQLHQCSPIGVQARLAGATTQSRVDASILSRNGVLPLQRR